MPHPPRPFLPGAFFVTSCGCHAGLAPACNPSTCAVPWVHALFAAGVSFAIASRPDSPAGQPGSWSPLRVRVGASSKALDMLMHAGPSLIRACRDKPTGCTLRATDREISLFGSSHFGSREFCVLTGLGLSTRFSTRFEAPTIPVFAFSLSHRALAWVWCPHPLLFRWTVVDRVRPPPGSA